MTDTAADAEQPAKTALISAGRVIVPPDEIEEFVADARATYAVAAANPGNIMISFCVEDAATGTVTVLEEWASQKALDQHVATAEVRALFEKWGSRMRNEVRKFDAFNERHPLD